jgi:hypothetical protein
MNIRIAGAALPLLLALGTAGCDRRDAEPIEPADSATTVIEDDTGPDVTTPAVPDPTATDTATGAEAPIDPCAGLTGEAGAECLMRNNDGLPPTTEPVNPDEETGEDLPPTP